MPDFLRYARIIFQRDTRATKQALDERSSDQVLRALPRSRKKPRKLGRMRWPGDPPSFLGVIPMPPAGNTAGHAASSCSTLTPLGASTRALMPSGADLSTRLNAVFRITGARESPPWNDRVHIDSLRHRLWTVDVRTGFGRDIPHSDLRYSTRSLFSCALRCRPNCRS